MMLLWHIFVVQYNTKTNNNFALDTLHWYDLLQFIAQNVLDDVPALNVAVASDDVLRM